MLFRIIRFIVHRILFFFFRHIYVDGLENVPTDKPVIIAASHTYALMDALLTLAVTPRPHYSMTRADIFDSGFKNWILDQLYMVPIYRARDGGDTVQRNQSTFQKVNEVLLNNEGILIFPEGSCVMTKAVQPLKKGTARMAFNLMEQEDIEVYIVPAGLNYSAYEKTQIDALISFGKPIIISNYKEQYEQHHAKAIRQATKDIQQALEKQMIIVSDEINDTTELALQLYRSDLQLPKWFTYKKDKNKRLHLEKQVADTLTKMHKAQPQLFKDFEESIKSYFNLLHQYNIEDAALIRKFGILEQTFLFMVWLTTLPLHLLNQIICIEQQVHKRVLKTLETTDDFFYSSFYIVYIMILVLSCLLIGWVGFGIWTGSAGLGFLASLLILLWMYSYVRCLPFFKLWKQVQQVNRLREADPPSIVSMLKQRLMLKNWLTGK